jgi:hypothetical protein
MVEQPLAMIQFWRLPLEEVMQADGQIGQMTSLLKKNPAKKKKVKFNLLPTLCVHVLRAKRNKNFPQTSAL